ncbi:MAG: O-antigen ligase family protein [Melioribacteraceae bacterium]|nr:O-antigen ligase family protein [Melioribacteraceae bacterium]
MPKSSKTIRIIDIAIFVFVILFLASLTNSIFVNQIGYYGALLLLIVKYYLTGKTLFRKTGLELPLLLFVVVEIISALLSDYSANAFQNVLKRVLLLPIIYVVASTADSPTRLKQFVLTYLAAALLTTMFYIGFAFEHFVNQLYTIEQKGPSPFQYVMTAGGLMSFTLIFFASLFFSQNKISKEKIFYFIGASVTAVALLSSYTRAAWLGALTGIFFLLILYRKWIYLIPAVVAIILYLIIEKDESRIYTYDILEKGLNEIVSFETDGSAKNVFSEANKLLVADYEDGIKIYEGNNLVNSFETKSPVIVVDKWKDESYLGILVDKRMFIFSIADDSIRLDSEFISPGNITDYKIINGVLYVAELDSGLTVFNNPSNTKSSFRYFNDENILRLDVSDSLLVFYSTKNNKYIFTKVDGEKISNEIYSEKINTVSPSIKITDNFVLLGSQHGLRVVPLNESKINTKELILPSVHSFHSVNESIIAVCYNGEVYSIKIENQELISEKIATFSYQPVSVQIAEDRLIVTSVKKNRLLSVIDLNHNTNLQRLQQWKIGINILADNPFFGVGDIDLKQTYSEYREYWEKEDFGHLHNNYVHVLVILGVIGFIVFVFLLIKIFIVHLRNFMMVKHSEFPKAVVAASFAAFVGFLVSGLAEWNFGDHEIITLVWYSVGISIAAKQSEIKKQS